MGAEIQSQEVHIEITPLKWLNEILLCLGCLRLTLQDCQDRWFQTEGESQELPSQEPLGESSLW